MSDSARNRFNEKEDFQVVLGKGNPGEPPCQQNSRWMAHWSRASRSAYSKSCSPLEDANNSNCTKDLETSLFELKKSSVAERLMLGEISVENVQQLNSNMWGAAHDVWQETEQKRIERQDGSFESSTVQMQGDENFYAKTVIFSETLSVRRLPDLPLDFQKLVNSEENLDSHWNQLPMLTINQKVDSILDPKRRSATGTVFTDLFVPKQTPMVNVAPSSLMELSHQEYELQPHRRTDRIMDHCKLAGGITRPREEATRLTRLTSDPAGKKLKIHSNSLSDYRIDEQDTCHYFPNPNREPLWKCSEKFNVSENHDKCQSVGGASPNQKSRTPAGFHERQTQEKFKDSSEGKTPCLFEILTTPAGLHSPNADSHLFGAQIQFSPKTENLHSDAQYVSKSSAGITSLLAQKDNGCSIKGSPGYMDESRLHNVDVNQDISSKATASTEQELCTETMDLDPLPSQPSKMDSATQSPTRADPSDRWLKRLFHDVADAHVPGSKRPRTGDCSPVGGASRTLGADIADHAAARSVHCWLGRLCRGGGAPASLEDLRQRMQKPEVAAGELGGHFPSIKAMAMMGRVMSKVRPPDRERKGPCVMWKTEGA